MKLYLSLNVYILIVISYYSFTRCYHCGKLNRGHRDLSVLFVASACKSTLISELKKNSNLHFLKIKGSYAGGII